MLLRAIVMLVSLGAAGCGGVPACAVGACGADTACDLDGFCRETSVSDALRFSRALRLEPSDWGATRDDQPSSVEGAFDELLLGGDLDGQVYLRFELPARAEVVSAILTLHMAADVDTAPPQRIDAFLVAPFDGLLTRAHFPPRRIGRVGPRRVLAGSGRPIHLDVTQLVRRAEPTIVSLGVRGEGSGPPWRVAAPSANDVHRRPHLDLRLR